MRVADINPKSIDLAALPSLSLELRSQLPAISCVYFVIEKETVLYIGRATNLIQRWRNHQRWYQLKDRSRL